MPMDATSRTPCLTTGEPLPHIGMWLTLDFSLEQMVGDVASTIRRLVNDPNKASNRPVDTTADRNRLCLEGVYKEMAFDRLWRLYPSCVLDTRLRSVANGTDRGDTLIFGKTVDVKGTEHIDGHLLPQPTATGHVDCFALMVGVFPRYKFCGFIETASLLRPDRIRDWGKHPTWGAPQSHLKEFVDLDWTIPWHPMPPAEQIRQFKQRTLSDCQAALINY